jgi:hypothetical protein
MRFRFMAIYVEVSCSPWECDDGRLEFISDLHLATQSRRLSQSVGEVEEVILFRSCVLQGIEDLFFMTLTEVKLLCRITWQVEHASEASHAPSRSMLFS